MNYNNMKKKIKLGQCIAKDDQKILIFSRFIFISTV